MQCPLGLPADVGECGQASFKNNAGDLLSRWRLKKTPNVHVEFLPSHQSLTSHMTLLIQQQDTTQHICTLCCVHTRIAASFSLLTPYRTNVSHGEQHFQRRLCQGCCAQQPSHIPSHVRLQSGQEGASIFPRTDSRTAAPAPRQLQPNRTGPHERTQTSRR